jgi:putative oxidoreductase
MRRRTAEFLARHAPSELANLPLLDRAAFHAGDVVLLLGRLAIGAIFLKSGFGKLMNLSGFATALAGRGVPMPSLAATVGAAVEFFAALAIILGLRVRYATVLMILFLVVATLVSHRYWDFIDAARRMHEIQFFKNVAILGGLLFLFVTAAGRYSLDHWLGRRRKD